MKTCPHCKSVTSARPSYGTRFPCGTRYDPIKGIAQSAQCASQVQYLKSKESKA